MDRLAYILLLGYVAAIHCSSTCHNRTNILLPKVVVPGQSTTALVHFHSKHEQHNVTLRLIRPANKFHDYELHTDVLAQNTVLIIGSGIIWLSVPSQENGIYEIQALLDCTPTDENCSLQASSNVKLSGSVRDIIIRPSSNYYRPSETITFWILAVDQSLHAPTSALATLCVKDANGIPVAIWEDVPLFEGTKEFQVPISRRAPLGKWSIEVKTEGNIYSSELNVSLARGSNQPPNREQVVTEKHFVELRFSNEMRRKYKPGLPLMGKVEAVSSEQQVRVRVKVVDDQLTVLYSQDIDMNGQEGTFYVPAVITNTEEIIVQAELISLGGKDVDSQYVLARETLRKWQSESNCYLLIRDFRNDLKPDIDAEVTVLTSCPSNGDMHYVVTNEGKMVSWGELTLSNQTNVSVILDSIMQGVNIYEFNISFAVEAQMAPRSHLLVYYTTETGEIIGDSVRFNVKLWHEKVSLIVDENNVWYAEDKIKVGILSFPKTHICLVGGRSEDVHFGSRTTTDLDRQILETSLSFLTSCNKTTENFELPKHQSYFPNTIINQAWVWKCFNYTEEIETNGISLPATNGPGKWKLWAFALSDVIELRISEPVTINVFSPVNVEFELPNTVKVMEIVQVEITISSNINSCIDIHAVIGLSEGAVYPGIDMSTVSEKLRLGGYGATSIVVRIQPVTSGFKTMTANVSCFVRNSCDEAANSIDELNNVKVPITSIIVRSRELEAAPEGIQKLHTESAYFCANEEVITIPSSEVTYKYVPVPRKKYSTVFDVLAEKNMHIALAEKENSTKNIYQIYLGDSDNSISWIGRGKRSYQVHLTNAQTIDLLSGLQYRTFWISWDNSQINVGNGSTVGKDTFLTHAMDRKMRVNYLGFATPWGVEGHVRISEHNDESGYSQVLRLDLPRNIVSGSEKGNLFITSGLSLPMILQQIEIQSISYPFSSLTSVLSSLTTVLLMDDTPWASEWLYAKHNRSFIREMTMKNIQTLLNYLNRDFSFSDHPQIFDHSNTVRAFEILSRAQYFSKIDSKIIANVKRWILKNQREDGHFYDAFSESLNDEVLVTAETIATFLEVGLDEEDNDMIRKSENYLVKNIRKINDTYTISVVCYALTLLKNNEADGLIERMRVPIRNEGDGNDWENSQSSVPSPFDWLYEKEKHMSDDERKSLTASYITDFKASSYAILIHTFRNDLKRAEPIVKYIFYRSSVLDQHVQQLSYLTAKALYKFSLLSRNTHTSLTISLATSGMELTDTLELKSEYIPHSLTLPSLPTKVFIYATGTGCSTVQSQVTYLSYEVATTHSFDFESFIEEEIPAHYNVVGDPEGLYPQLIIKSCFKLDNHSNGFRMEAILFSGYRLDSVLSVSPTNVNVTYDSAEEKLWFVFENISANCGICVRYLIQSSFIISSLRPMFFRMYEIENPQIMQELFVHTRGKDSLLRTDVIDAHFVMWFGSQNERMNQPNDVSRFNQCDVTDQLENQQTTPKYETDDIDSKKVMIVDVDNFIDELNPTSFTSSMFESSSTAIAKNTKSNNVSTHSALNGSDVVGNIPLSSTHRPTNTSPLPMKTTISRNTNAFSKTTLSNTETTRILSANTNATVRYSDRKSILEQAHRNKNRNSPGSSTMQPAINSTLTLPVTKGSSNPSKMSKRKKVLQSSKSKAKETKTNGLTTKSNKTNSATDIPKKDHFDSTPEFVGRTLINQNRLKLYAKYDFTNVPSTTVQNPTAENRTTTSALWGMLREVAYDTKGKYPLK